MKGPAVESQAVAAMYLALSPRFQALDMAIELLELTPRGSWRVQTQQGAQIELGRGSRTEILQRLDMFLTTLKQVTARYGRGASAVASADLRHKDAYALRLHGVSTVDANNKQKP
jgi:cell division protein FtsQ